jgi:sulfatase maturation enzyme AslB (radical SAM superfamily)
MQTFNKIPQIYMPINFFQKIVEKNHDFINTNYSGVAPYFRGEPLIHPEFWKFCEILKNYKIRNLGVNSNFNMKINFERWIKNCHVPILVNIGGITKETHESVMLRSNYELVIDNLKKAFSLGLPVSVKMNVTRRNFSQHPMLSDFICSLGGSRSAVIDYTTTCPVPLKCTEGELKYFFDHVYSDRIDEKLRFYLDQNGEIITKSKSCNHRSDAIYVDGKMTICCQDQYGELCVGDVNKQTLAEITQSELYKTLTRDGAKKLMPICKYCS